MSDPFTSAFPEDALFSGSVPLRPAPSRTRPPQPVRPPPLVASPISSPSSPASPSEDRISRAAIQELLARDSPVVRNPLLPRSASIVSVAQPPATILDRIRALPPKFFAMPQWPIILTLAILCVWMFIVIIWLGALYGRVNHTDPPITSTSQVYSPAASTALGGSLSVAASISTGANVVLSSANSAKLLWNDNTTGQFMLGTVQTVSAPQLVIDAALSSSNTIVIGERASAVIIGRAFSGSVVFPSSVTTQAFLNSVSLSSGAATMGSLSAASLRTGSVSTAGTITAGVITAGTLSVQTLVSGSVGGQGISTSQGVTASSVSTVSLSATSAGIATIASALINSTTIAVVNTLTAAGGSFVALSARNIAVTQQLSASTLTASTLLVGGSGLSVAGAVTANASLSVSGAITGASLSVLTVLTASGGISTAGSVSAGAATLSGVLTAASMQASSATLSGWIQSPLLTVTGATISSLTSSAIQASLAEVVTISASNVTTDQLYTRNMSANSLTVINHSAVNVVATHVSSTDVHAETYTGTTISVTGAVNAGSLNVTGATVNFLSLRGGHLTASSLSVGAAISVAGVTSSAALTATTAVLSGVIQSGSVQTGALTATAVTVSSLTAGAMSATTLTVNTSLSSGDAVFVNTTTSMLSVPGALTAAQSVVNVAALGVAGDLHTNTFSASSGSVTNLTSSNVTSDTLTSGTVSVNGTVTVGALTSLTPVSAPRHAFSAYQTSQRIVGSTVTQLVFNQTAFNTFDRATLNLTDGTFTAPETGLYRFTLSLFLNCFATTASYTMIFQQPPLPALRCGGVLATTAGALMGGTPAISVSHMFQMTANNNATWSLLTTATTCFVGGSAAASWLQVEQMS